MTMKIIKGLFAPIPTPFTVWGDVDYRHLEANLARWGGSSLTGVVVLGSNGEFVSLLEEEKIELIKFVRRHLPADKMMIVGSGCESDRGTNRLNAAAADAGADAVLVITPSYFKGAINNSDNMKAYFTAVADRSPLPVMLYNMPGNSGVNIPAAVTCALSEHPNIVGIKDSSGNIAQIAEAVGFSAPNFSVFAGSGSFLMPTLAMGGKGGTLAVANIAAGYCSELMDRSLAGDYDTARKMQYALLPLNAAVTSRFGVPGLKAAMDYLGYYGGPSRLPFQDLKEDQKKELHSIIDNFQEKTGWQL